MSSLINTLIPVEDFFSEIHDLIKSGGIHFYINKIAGSQKTIIKIQSPESLSPAIDDHYHAIYITSEAFEESKHKSFFDDDFCIHAIEVLGGRSTPTELENLSLRIISKTPDKKIKSFFSKLDKYLKENNEYGMGVGPGTSSFYKKIFYKKEAIKGKTLWFDFERKAVPITITEN